MLKEYCTKQTKNSKSVKKHINFYGKDVAKIKEKW